MNNDPPSIHPTLKDLDYESGDFYPILVFSTRSVAVNTAETAAWNSGYETNEFQITDSDRSGQTVYLANYRVNAHGDQIDVRLWNSTDQEALPNSEVSVSAGNTWVNRSVGPQDYTPTTTDTPVAIQPQFRNADGATQVDLSIAQVEIGVII